MGSIAGAANVIPFSGRVS